VLVTDLAIGGRPAYELLLTITAFATPHRVDSYTVGQEWFDAAETRLGSAETAELRRLNAGCEHVFVRLFGLAHDLAAPAEADDLVDAIREMDPADLRLMLLGYFSKRTRRRATPELIAAAADGDPASQRVFVTATADGPDCERALGGLLAVRGAELQAALVATLTSWISRVFIDDMTTVRPILESEADRLRRRAAELSQDAFLDEATGGATVVAEPGTETIEIFPHWALRPWNVFWEHGTSQIIGVAVPPQQATTDPDEPPERLIAIAKALGDERRLRVLRRLTTGSFTLQELADHFGIPKTTLLHHLVILRAAGIVRVGPGTSGRYSLRPDVPHELSRLLEAYLPIVPPSRFPD
jgi:DNA-binding transcriptional ArsR family regulator